ncbi:lipid-A-disaccharide synthase [Gabonibacter chumensis]|uniref:lipid-A-disaccharide synthase n=1 Tax=Gabonibacter chumensis TaxID=2972474 RepID=UPI002572BD39|nr:lipid-A-disaccharide synthase [Gabonibacter chumensis]MCR9011857.1 lipid-A-disaccharide synthase [Gabonibacter chumensis]
MKYYIIAGEASGDLHASNLIKGLRREDPEAVIRGWGGDLMRNAGCEIVRHYKDTAIMGFLTVLKNLGKIKENIEACHQDILAWKPDVVILVDYGGVNLRVAKFIKAAGIPVFYYISPKIWAWNTGRVKKIKCLVDRMYVIFPFEVDFYRQFDYTVQYAGNPLVDAIHDRDFKDESYADFIRGNRLPDKPIIALLAGSRSQELKHVLPKMLSMVKHFPGYQFVIAGAPSMSDTDYAPYIKGMDIRIVYGQTYRLLKQARCALVTSGTATLETAILKTPQVVCYSGEGGALSYFLFKTFVKVKYISLVNLIAGKEVVRELLMQKLNEKNLLKALSAILPDDLARKQMLREYDEVNRRLGDSGASERFARMMIRDLKALRGRG